MYKLCKSEQSAARQRQLELGLLEMMSAKRYEEITVSELCDHLNIPRKSFYRYFSSKDGALHALIDHTMLNYECFNSVYTSGERRTPERELQQFFLFWMEHKSLLDALAKSGMSGTLVERAMCYSTGTIASSRFLQDETLFARQQVMLFCISGLMSMVLTWHHDGYPQSAEQMATIAARLVTQPLFPNLQSFF